MTRVNNTDLKDVWQTPNLVLNNIKENISLDPCAGSDTEIGDVNYTENGLENSWNGVVFVNPPFSQKKDFLQKTVKEVLHNDDVKRVYFLTPDSTDTKSWWHEYIANYAEYIWFSRGRINYISPEGFKPNPERKCDTNNVTFGTAISIFGEKPPDKTLISFSENGQLVETVRF